MYIIVSSCLKEKKKDRWVDYKRTFYIYQQEARKKILGDTRGGLLKWIDIYYKRGDRRTRVRGTYSYRVT